MNTHNKNTIEDEIIKCVCGRSTDGLCHCITICHTSISNDANDSTLDNDCEYYLEEYD